MGGALGRAGAGRSVASEMESSKCCREELCCHPMPWARPPSLPFLHTCTWGWQGEFLLPPAPLWSSSLHCLFRDQNWARKKKIQPHKAWQLRALPEASRSQAKQHSWGAAGSWPQPLGTQRSYILTPTS